MSMQEEAMLNKNNTDREKANIKREELGVKRDIADKQLQIARENKNKYDDKKSTSKKKD
jgi:hypothetical protein